MEYEQLTPEQREEIVNRRILQAEADHYNETLNAEQAESAGETQAAARHRGAAQRIENAVIPTLLKEKAGGGP